MKTRDMHAYGTRGPGLDHQPGRAPRVPGVRDLVALNAALFAALCVAERAEANLQGDLSKLMAENLGSDIRRLRIAVERCIKYAGR